MSINEQQQQLPSAFNKFILGLLSAAIILSVGTLATVWKQSALIEQRVDGVDAKYIDKSAGVIKRIDILALSLASHFSDDNAHQLMIQRQHLMFEGFMDKLDTAHEDIEQLKQQQSVIKQFCCSALRNNGDTK